MTKELVLEMANCAGVKLLKSSLNFNDSTLTQLKKDHQKNSDQRQTSEKHTGQRLPHEKQARGCPQ